MVGTFACSICSKKFKTQGGRSRHMIPKHEENVIKGISVNELQSLLKHTQTDISQDLDYSIEVRNKISTIITEFEINRLHNVISPLYEKLEKISTQMTSWQCFMVILYVIVWFTFQIFHSRMLH